VNQVTLNNNTDLFSLTIDLYGDISFLFDVIDANNIDSITGEIETGTVINYPVVTDLPKVEVQEETENPIKTAVVLENQNLFDLAIQYGGSVESIFEIMDANPDVITSITSQDLSGKVISYTEKKLNLTEYFRKNKIFIATADNTESTTARAFDDSFDLSFG
jgi:hypothetical protein